MNSRLQETAILFLATYRNPKLFPTILFRLLEADDPYPEILEIDNELSHNRTIKAVRALPEIVLRKHAIGMAAIDSIAQVLKSTMSFAYSFFINAFSSLWRGKWPEIFSPNPLFLAFKMYLEKEIMIYDQDTLIKTALERINEVGDLKKRVENLLNLPIDDLEIRLGPVAPGDFLITRINNKRLLIMHPAAPSTYLWPSVVIHELTGFCLYQNDVKVEKEIRDSLAILVEIASGFSSPKPGTFSCLAYQQLNQESAQQLLSTILSKILMAGEKNQEFPIAEKLEKVYLRELTSSIILFTFPETQGKIDERELYARVVASDAGYRIFYPEFIAYLESLKLLEQRGLIEKVGDSLNFIGKWKEKEILPYFI